MSNVQNITYENPSPFVTDDIDFPNNINFTNLCDISMTNPANLPAGFDYPTYEEDGNNWISVYATDFENMTGFQIGLRQNGLEIVTFTSDVINIDSESYVVNKENGLLKMI